MSLTMAFCVVLAALAIGDVISTKTKAAVPAVFASAVIFLIGFWTFFPQNIVDLAGFQTPVVVLSILLIITHMGTTFSLKELLAQWKTILIAIGAIIGICALVLTIGSFVFGREITLVATPPLTGGIVAAVIMGDAATKKGVADLAVLATLVFVMQGFFGYPLGSIMLKKEAQRLIKEFRAKGMTAQGKAQTETASTVVTEEKSKLRIFPPMPGKYLSAYMLLLKLGLVAWAAVGVAGLTNGKIHQYVLCLIFGVIAAEIGFIERKPLNASGSFGFLLTVLMAYIFVSLNQATPETVLQIIGPLCGIIILGIIGIYIVCSLVGKLLGESKEMAFAIGLNALYGFPPNFILTEGAAKAIGENEEEVQYLMDRMLPKMLVGGFVTVTICSVLIAGILVNYL